MTPNTQRAVLAYPHRAAEYHWFDIGELDEHRVFTHGEVSQLLLEPLPFDKCAITGKDSDGVVFSLLVTRGTEGEYENALCLETAIAHPQIRTEAVYEPAFWVRPDQSDIESGLELQFVDPKTRADAHAAESSRQSAMVLAVFLELVHTKDAYTMYTPLPSSSNNKRIRQGKMPLFSWHTVIIEPPKQKMPEQGGTHASPRLHDVRGHWVNRNGKRFWRKPHQRGDASLGISFHDYKLKGEVNA